MKVFYLCILAPQVTKSNVDALGEHDFMKLSKSGYFENSVEQSGGVIKQRNFCNGKEAVLLC